MRQEGKGGAWWGRVRPVGGGEGRALDLKQQDLYHLESNLCQLCLQVKLSNLTARVSTWGCGHVQGGVARLGVHAGDALGCEREFVCACMCARAGAQWRDAGVGSCCQKRRLGSSSRWPSAVAFVTLTQDCCTSLPILCI